ncbi:LytTR family DNA-binding domain-containing protein [Palleronia caenipelagi]|uniref:LytTR family transcriptional regulator n=1 Tax=Palleronia caenipelagi TaxID=2489174 RepID=A0A547PKS3_9RHOB|nr:LytTR family DNA-binding domain-containing protein [Palleronia caenipelagi]TRD14703.1 LytTR family transcriptional regulator [Palleronia caenipelagi]
MSSLENARDEIRHHRRLITSIVFRRPVILIMTSYMLLYVLTEAFGLGAELSLAVNALKCIGWTAYSLFLFYFIMPPLAYYFSIKRWPIFYVNVIINFIASITGAILSEYVDIHLGVASGWGFPRFIQIVTVAFLVYTALIYIIDTSYEQLIIDHFREVQRDVMLFRFPPRTPAVLEKVPFEKRGSLLRIEADGHYCTIVTSRGKHIVRQSMMSCIEDIDESQGILIHRSIWMANSEISRLVYHNGNPRVIDRNGSIYPVSRKKANEVKEIAARHGSSSK